MRLSEVLNASSNAELVIASRVLRKDKAWVLSHLDDEVPDGILKNLLSSLEKFRTGFPLQYITGEKEFMGLTFRVEEGVFVPRYETETLVEIAIELVREHGLKLVADVGTGTGVIGVSIAKYTGVRVVATDISEKAVEISMENAKRHGVSDRFEVKLGKFLEPFLDIYDEIDLIVSNPPYVERGAKVPREVLLEPEEAVFAGEDGLDFFREFFRRYDVSGKYVLMEFNGKSRREIEKIVGRNLSFMKDLDGIERFFLITPS